MANCTHARCTHLVPILATHAAVHNQRSQTHGCADCRRLLQDSTQLRRLSAQQLPWSRADAVVRAHLGQCSHGLCYGRHNCEWECSVLAAQDAGQLEHHHVQGQEDEDQDIRRVDLTGCGLQDDGEACSRTDSKPATASRATVSRAFHNNRVVSHGTGPDLSALQCNSSTVSALMPHTSTGTTEACQRGWRASYPSGKDSN